MNINNNDFNIPFLKKYLKNNNSVDMNSLLCSTAIILEDKTDVIKYLIESKADIDYDNNDSNSTPLNIVSLHGYFNSVKYLVNNKANIDNTETDGYTPLKSAVINKHVDIVEFLVENGATIEGNTNTTALSIAKHNSKDNLIYGTIANYLEYILSFKKAFYKTTLIEPLMNYKTNYNRFIILLIIIKYNKQYILPNDIILHKIMPYMFLE